ncbi:hypothetical protein BKI52_39645 [marine bacterium AO1-C]|nr:hypothetical protein BKI52_39645 [marine bacterium AO1-C]
MTQVVVINKIKQRLKVSSKDLFFTAIILGLVIALLYKITQTGFMKQETRLLEQKNQVLDTYLSKLDRDIKDRQYQIANLDSTNQEQKEDLINQLNFLKQKRKEILKLRQEKEINYQKILALTSAIDRQQANNQKVKDLQRKVAWLNDSIRSMLDEDGDIEVPGWQYKFENLQSSYKELMSENRVLKTRLSTLSGKVFATNIHSQPGEMLRGKFDPSTRARRTSLIKLKFKLTRVLQTQEKLIIKLFDQNQQEFALKGNYLSELRKQATNYKTIYLEPANTKRFRRGKNTVKLFLANNGQAKPIGVHSLYLR